MQIEEAEELQARPWHREGVDQPPVRRVNTSAIMKGI
jgi:hypothetical protein